MMALDIESDNVHECLLGESDDPREMDSPKYSANAGLLKRRNKWRALMFGFMLVLMIGSLFHTTTPATAQGMVSINVLEQQEDSTSSSSNSSTPL